MPDDVTVRAATPADAPALASVAAATFALACPPGTSEDDIADFIRTALSEQRFAEYLADPARVLLLAEVAGGPAGYTMLVLQEPTDADVAAAITTRPTAELSKVYTLPTQHGSGLAAALMSATLDAAREHGAAAVWLGVNQHNDRANRFYEKQGFVRVGSKRFRVGTRWHDDHVRERVLSVVV